MAIKDSFSCITYAFYSQYNTVWIANMEIGLDPENSVIKRLWCIWLYHRVMSPNDADRMANSVDPDQTAPVGAV